MSIISEIQLGDIPSSSTTHDVVVQMNERNQKLSIPADFHLLDISQDNDYMAVLQNDGNLVVYKLKLANGGIDYEGEVITYDAGDIEGANPAYVFLSVCSGTGDVVLSFAEIDMSGLFATKKPESEYRHCRIFRTGNDNYDTIKFQGRAVYTNKKLVLVGEHTLQVHHTGTLNMEYFLDFHYLKMDFPGLIGGESITQQVTWARRIKLNQNSVDDGARLISMTLHIHSNILVTSHKSGFTIVWSILDGSSLASFRQGKSGNFMAVSEDQQLIATYEKENKCVNVYFSKSGLRLYTYHHKGVNLDQPDSYVTSVRLSASLNYIAISGITKYIEEPAKYKSFYEVWSISQEQLFLSVEEKNVFKDAVKPFILENLEEPNESRHNSSTPSPQGPDNNEIGSENGRSGKNTPQPSLVDSSPKPRNYVLYGISTTENSNKLEFRTALVYDYDKQLERDDLLPEVIDWKDLQFKKLNEGVIQRGFLHDICDPLDGKNSVSYVLNHESGIYLLRFGACMTQLWKLLQIPNDRLEEAKKDKKLFDFGNLPSSSEKLYYNTLTDNNLIFARAHPVGYTIFPTFRDTLNCCEPTFKVMKRDGHIIVNVKKEFNVYLPSSSNLDTGIDENDRQTETISLIEDLFLPLSKINSRDAEYELYEIESAYRILHYIDSLKYLSSNSNGYSKDVFKENRDSLIKQIENNINKALESEKGRSYFLTISGSRTMGILASFESGRKKLYDIIWTRKIPFNILSYRTERRLMENVLTVLIEKTEYNFFNLMLNQMLIDYYEKGFGNLSAIVDALFFLQKENYTARLFDSIKKLSFLPAKEEGSEDDDDDDDDNDDDDDDDDADNQQLNEGFISLLNSEHRNMLSIKGLQQENISRVAYLDTYSITEQLMQLGRYDYSKWYLLPIHWIAYKYACFCRNASVQATFMWTYRLYHKLVRSDMKHTNLAKLCIVPLPYFNSYETLIVERGYFESEKDIETQYFNGVEYYKYSPFSLLALSIYDNSIFKQGDTVMEMFITYKWKTFARSRFYLILFCHSVYYVAYSTGVSFPEELFDYKPGTPLTHHFHYVAIGIMFIFGFILLVQEYRQYTLSKVEYFKSYYNYLDLAAFIFPTLTFILLRTQDPTSDVHYAVSSFTTLILWAHMILRLRVFRPVGNLLEIIIQLTGKIFPVIFIMILIVMGFTNAFIVLLRRQHDDFFQDEFSGNTASGTDIDMSNRSQQDLFKDIFLAFTTVWFFIFGYFDPLFSGNVGNYVMSIILVVLFSFIVVLILFNVIIALMSGTIEEIRKKGNKIWMAHFAAVVGEIELLWSTNAARYSKKNNPTHVYYNANIEAVRSHHEKIVKESEKLKKNFEKSYKLKINRKQKPEEEEEEINS